MSSNTDRWKRYVGAIHLGPGMVVAAAFVGPGTVTTAAAAGADFGLSVAWVVVFAILATVLLQEMSARLGTLTGIGLGDMLRRQIRSPRATVLMALLVVCAIAFGNAAYQAGNLIGAALGIEGFLLLPRSVIIVAIAIAAGGLLWQGSYRVLERVLVTAVAAMGIVFVVAAGIAIAKRGLAPADLRPRIPAGSLTTVLALIGTTIVPYNLFLHASAAKERWSKVRPRAAGLRQARVDSAIGITIGGIVTIAILIVFAMTSAGREIRGAADMASALDAVLGRSAATVLFSIGLAAAGITSAITAPLAAAYAVCGICGWPINTAASRFRFVWIAVLGTGATVAMLLGGSPMETIVFAQAANAIVLPIIAGCLIAACNAKLLGKYANGPITNIAAALVLAVVITLSVATLLSLF